MKSLPLANIGSNLMVLLVILLVAIIAIELFYLDFGDTSADESKRGMGTIEALQEAFRLPPMSKTFTEMVERPLFVPNRRPAVQVSLTQTDLAKQLAAGELNRTYAVEGIILAAGNNMILLKDKTTGKYFHLSEGQIIDGMEIQTLEPHQVVLKKGSQTEMLELKMQAQTGPRTMMLPTGDTVSKKETVSSSKKEEGKELSLYERRMALRARQAREREARKNSAP